MSELMYKSTTTILNLIERLVEINITTDGMENIGDHTPYLFCANHFTRMETFILPYAIHKLTKMQVRSLADHSVFVGLLGDYMKELGTVSTQDDNRDNIILSDLILNRSSWIIYPEGIMLKNKKVSKDKDGFVLDLGDKTKRVHNGSSVYALKSEIEKQNYIEYKNEDNKEKLKEFREKYMFKEDDEISYKNTLVVPLTITYSPIRSEENSIKSLLDNLMDHNSAKLDEEMLIEGYLLLNSHIHISFGTPIDIHEYIFPNHNELSFDNDIINNYKHELTNRIMANIYQDTLINFDHIFAITLEYYPQDKINIDEFKIAMYLICREILSTDTFNLHPFLHDGLYKLLNHENFEPFEDIMSLALKDGVLKKVNNTTYKIDRDVLNDSHTFDTIRIKNILRVLINELSILENLIYCVKEQMSKSAKQRAQDSFYTFYRRDMNKYKELYNKFYSVMDSKPIDIGEPFVRYNKKFTKGVVLSHGYLSSPKEVEYLAEFFFKNGFNVYALRLAGHGTHCDDLKNKSHEEWYESFDKAYSAISIISKEIYLCGFSTGGLLSLLLASKKDYKIKAQICINSAISLQDIRVKYLVPTLNAFSNLLSVFDLGYDYVESESENPHINYSKHYLTSINELGKLIAETNEKLPLVKIPTLIIHSSNDPVVDPESADIIYNKISSKVKEIQIIDSDKHVIVTTDKRELVFEKISNFLSSLKRK